MPKRNRASYAPTFKMKVLDDLQATGDSGPTVATRHGIQPRDVYNWKALEKKIRKEAAKEMKQEKPNGEAHANGLANGTKPASVGSPPKTELRISGLTPLIRELVVAELEKQLAPIVEERLTDIVKKAFAGRAAG